MSEELPALDRETQRYREYLKSALEEVKAGNTRMRPYAEAYAVELDRLVHRAAAIRKGETP